MSLPVQLPRHRPLSPNLIGSLEAEPVKKSTTSTRYVPGFFAKVLEKNAMFTVYSEVITIRSFFPADLFTRFCNWLLS